MTGPEEAVAPHAAAEQDPRDPGRAANQIHDEPIPPTPAHGDMPSADSEQPDVAADDDSSPAAAGGAGADELQLGANPDRPQAGVPDGTATDKTPALGTSEELEPVQGVHTPGIGPGGADMDTADPAERSRAAGTS